MSNISKDFVTKNGIVIRGTSFVTGLTSQTNALQVNGGAAIAKNIIIGSTATIQGTLFATNTDNAISTTTASAVFSGGLAVAKDVRIGGTLFGLIDGLISTATNIADGTAGQVLYQISPGRTGFVGPGISGNILSSNGTNAPSYVTTTSLYVGRALVADNSAGTAAFANNLNGGRLGEIPYQTGTNATAFIGTGTQGSLLQMGANTASFVTSSTIQVGFAANLLAGAVGSIPYQTAANATAMLGIGTNKSILVSNGSIPSWTVNPTIGGNVIIEGNLTVQGTTTQVDSTVTNVADPIITVGLSPGGTIPLVDDAKDRGIAFAWTGTQAGLNTGRTGFFGFDRSTLFFTFITSASITNEVVAPAGGTTRGAIDANLAGGTAGQLLFQSAPNTTGFVGPGLAGEILVSSGASSPTYTATGTIYVGLANSSNNIRGGILGQIPYQLGTNNTAFIGTGTSGSILQMGANTATFVTTANIYVNSAVNAQNIFGGTAGQLHIQTAPGVTGFAGPGTAGQLLVSAGSSAPVYTNTSSINVGLAVTATNIILGTAGQLVYQIGPGQTGFAGPGTAGQILTSGGTGAPTYLTTTSVYIGRTVLADSATNIVTIAQPLNAAYFPTFVDTNNTIATQEPVFTTSSFSINPSSGNLTIGGTAGTHRVTVRTAITAPGTDGLSVESGSTSTVIRPWLAAASGNPAVQANDSGIIFTDGRQGFGNLFIGPASSTSTGIRISSAGSVFATTIHGNGAGVNSTTTGVLRVIGGIGVWGSGFFTGVVTATSFVGSFDGTANIANNLAGGILGQIPFQTGPNVTSFIGTGTAGTILQMGANTATFVTTANIYVNSAVNAQNIFGGTAGQLHIQTAPGVTGFAGPGTAGQLLVSAGSSAPVYTNTTTIQVGFAANLLAGAAGQFAFQTAPNATSFVSTSGIYVNNAVTATNVRDGTAGQLVYQSAPGVTAFAGPGTAGQILTSGGSGAPTYVTTTTLYVGRAVNADVVTGPAANLQGGRLGEIPYQTAPNSTGFIGTGTQGSLLQMGANTASFITSSTIQVGFAATAGAILSANTVSTRVGFADVAGRLLPANTSTQQVGFAANLLAGAGGSIPYQSAANATTMLGIGANNAILVSNGSLPSWTINPTIGGNLTVVGNLTVQGTTTQVDSTVTNVSDPIFTIGTAAGGTIPVSDDGRDRGIAFAWTGTQAGLNTGRTGFFGFDRSTLYFTFVTSASITNEVIAPAGGTTRGAIDANLAGGTAGQLVYQSAADTTAFAGPGSAGNVLTSNGTSAPSYVTTTSLYVGRALVADTVTGPAANLAGGILGQIPYQLGPNSTAFIGTGTTGSLLQMGANTATFVTTGTVYVGFANQANNVRAGTAGQLVYQSAANTTAFAGPGTTGQVLISGGTGAPNYQNTLTVNASVVGVSSTLASTSTNTGALQVAGGVGVAGSVYVGNRVGFVNTGNFSVVYQVYNPVTNSLDTVFG